MSHVTLKNSYKTLSDRLNLFPQGAPPSELLFQILEVLFTRDEAALVALLAVLGPKVNSLRIRRSLARPPAAVTASTMRESSAATSTGPTSASIARRQTWTIIGSPQMSASGLPGSRVELMRAGTRTIGLTMAAMKNAPKKLASAPRLYVLPRQTQSG